MDRVITQGGAHFERFANLIDSQCPRESYGTTFWLRERLKDFSSPDLGDSGELAVDDIDYVAGFRDGLLGRAERARVACVF